MQLHAYNGPVTKSHPFLLGVKGDWYPYRILCTISGSVSAKLLVHENQGKRDHCGEAHY